jgi:predicted Zn-dependent protease
MEIPALSSFSSGVNLDALPASEIETRLRDFFSGRIANPKPDDLIQSVNQLEQQFGDYKEFQFAKAAMLVQACDFAGARGILLDLVKQLPSDSRVLHRLAIADLNMGAAHEAQDVYLSALAAAPKNSLVCCA